MLVWEDKRFGASLILQGRRGGRFPFRMEGFDDSPDYFVAGAGARRSVSNVTENEPFQSDYAWGRVELVD